MSTQAPFVCGDVVRSSMLGRLGRVTRAYSSTATITWTDRSTTQVMQQCAPGLVERLDPETKYGAAIHAYVADSIGPWHGKPKRAARRTA